MADGALELSVRVVPRSSRNRIAGVLGDRLKLQVTGPPVDGAANACVVETIARAAGLPPRCCSVTAGATGRSKTVRLETAGASAVAAKLVALVAAIR
jgi:uncharacterized protein